MNIAAKPATVSTATPPSSNPMGTDGFEFVEYTAENPEDLRRVFEALGFVAVARHRSKNVTLYRQGDINFIVNGEPKSRAQRFAREHGPGACAMAFRVADAAAAHARALELGAADVPSTAGPMELNIPAIEGIGGSVIYLVDRYGSGSGTIYDVDFVFDPKADRNPKGAGLAEVDHLTNNVYRGRMDVWAGFYERLFNMREIRYFDIEGKLTGLRSRAMTAPCGKIRIPINESVDDKSQVEEYLHRYRGEGIQHIALSTNDIFATFDALKARGVKFMEPPPPAYYDNLDARLPGHGESIDALKSRGILLDGNTDGGKRLLLQIFTDTMIGPIFFEIIQRKGDEGFGEGNFKALFESIEQDQVRRGVLQDK
ncbi:MAG: 4-hydroxyphenylpyruvate dioxygenase [Rhodospirillaceae bacterium]|nr:4-hydroxyphenylpyruvate dioxygenase [Rhodospirillaceae bacterium]